jgi:hypothetical protein
MTDVKVSKPTLLEWVALQFFKNKAAAENENERLYGLIEAARLSSKCDDCICPTHIKVARILGGAQANSEAVKEERT